MMDGQTNGSGVEAPGDARKAADVAAAGSDADGDSRSRGGWRRVVRRASAMFSQPREGDAVERLNAFLSGEAAEGEARTRGERALLTNVIKLRDLRVDDVMVPRADIIAVELSTNLDETLTAFRESSFSRLPVYRDTLDDPVGVVHLKDLALSFGFGAAPGQTFSLANHLRSALVAPPSMKILALLERMQAQRRHMALVIDEYGGVDGLITIEDIIEQIVGEIEDEHDGSSGPDWRREADGAYLADARAYIEDFEREIGAPVSNGETDEEVDTLGGLVFTMIGRIPERGEVILHPHGHEFEIVDADPRRIKRLRVRISDRSDVETQDEAGVEPTSGAPASTADKAAETGPDEDSAQAQSAA